MTTLTVAPPSELAGFRDVDQHVYRIACRMAANDWPRGTAAREYAATYGLGESRVENWAAEAARLNRLLGVADYLRTKALHVVDRTLEMEHAPGLALAAAKLVLERVDARGPGSGAPAGTDRTLALEGVLQDPPPELVAMLERCGWVRREAL
jgi:hypothetical protein